MTEFIDSLQVIIVLYNIALEESESFLSIRDMDIGGGGLSLFVYDNSEQPQSMMEYKNLHVYYRHDPKNSGVSKAYNEGSAYALKYKKKWVLLLDQDTSLPSSLLKKYWEATKQNPELKLFVPVLELKNGKIFSPCTYRFKRGFYLNTIKKGTHSLQKLSPVNSGMLINVTTFFKVGGYNEKVKLDFSDFQFIERFRKKHMQFFVVDCIGKQDFSEDNVSQKSQAVRFGYFCEGAKNIEKHNLWDSLQYHIVVFFRALRLSRRYNDFGFIKTYFGVFFQ